MGYGAPPGFIIGVRNEHPSFGLLARDVSLAPFDKAAIGALIAVIGTGMTSLGALYTANRQAQVAREVEGLRAKLMADLDTTKAAEALERLKAFLDTGKSAYRELNGAAATYFYALRSIAPMLHLYAALTEKERRLITERTRETSWLAPDRPTKVAQDISSAFVEHRARNFLQKISTSRPKCSCVPTR